MSVRTGGAFSAGMLTPRKYDRVLVQYKSNPVLTGSTITEYGYYGAGRFLGRTVITTDTQGREIDIRLYNQTDLGTFDEELTD